MAATITRAAGEAMRDSALRVPGVAGLSSGRFGEVALLLPGTRVTGIRHSERHGGAELHVIYDAGSGLPIADVADAVRAAAFSAARGAGMNLDAIDIIVADAQKVSPS